MAELIPISLSKLLKRISSEYQQDHSLFNLPERKFYFPSTDVDLSVNSCGAAASNPLGPAAGPHTQLAQNIVLAWLAGARIIELKTVQVRDRLSLSRPCIDASTVCYNTEWSQELRLDDSAREYVKASMLVELLKHWLFREQADSRLFQTIFDVSVGYNLAGIQSPSMCRWLETMQDASVLLEELRAEIPDEFSPYRNLPFKTKISDSVTLSTFHGTPADEIERICEFLIDEMGFHVVVKMNPPMLGKERLEYLLHDTLGYTTIEVNPRAYDDSMAFPHAVEMMKRLQLFAMQRGKTVGVKFGNTLEVVNKGSFLKEKLQYLSGQPLHVLHLALVNEWRKVMRAEFPVSFSAGVDAGNVADCVALGMTPVTVCTDLLREGGYGRLHRYLVNIEQRMHALNAKTISELITATAAANGKNGTDVNTAILFNTELLAEQSAKNSRYHYSSNQKPPKKVGSHLKFWDCLNCDKCIQVCPNDANFSFEVAPESVQYKNMEVAGNRWKEIEGGVCLIQKQHQIGNYADACNECGNCDVFCPEDGGPYLEKPRFFGSRDSYKQWSTRDGFLYINDVDVMLMGRFGGEEYELILDAAKTQAVWKTGNAKLTIDWHTGAVLNAATDLTSCVVEMRYYHTMAAILRGIINSKSNNFIN